MVPTQFFVPFTRKVAAGFAVLGLLVASCGDSTDDAAVLSETSETESSGTESAEASNLADPESDDSTGEPATDTQQPTTSAGAEDSSDAGPRSAAAVSSSGCSNPDSLPNPQQMQPLQVGDTARQYLVSMPTARGSDPLPVIVDFHGYSEGAVVHTLMTGLGTLGEQERFITVTPQGSGPVPLWNFTAGSNDMDLVDTLLDDLSDRWCIDTSRIFAAGLSNGAFMTSAVSCQNAERFAAAATVAGMLALPDCDPARPMPVISFHGTEDTYVSFDGGLGEAIADLPTPDGTATFGDEVGEGTGSAATDVLGAGDDNPTVPEIAQRWADRNGCASGPETEEVGKTENGEAIRVQSWTDCPDNSEVQLHIIEGGGHAWPGSEFSQSAEALVGFTTLEVDANALMWEFFQDHPLPG